MGILGLGFIGWIVLCFLAAYIASTKNRSALGFFLLSLIFSPLIGLIAAAAVGPIVYDQEQLALERGEREYCPHCAELIVRGAMTCRFCGKSIERGAPALYHTKVSVGGLSLLVLPNPRTRTIGTLKKGQPLSVLKEMRATDGTSWLRVRTERGNEGWIATAHVERRAVTEQRSTSSVGKIHDRPGDDYDSWAARQRGGSDGSARV